MLQLNRLLMQALSGEACYRTCTRPKTRKSVQKCDKSHAQIKLLNTLFYYIIACLINRCAYTNVTIKQTADIYY